MKKTLALVLTLALTLLSFAACGGNKDTQKDNAPDTSAYTLQGIVDSIYAQKAPMFMFGSMPVDLEDADAVKMFLGLDDASKVTDAIVSEAMMGSQAYSLVVVRAAEGIDAQTLADEMKAGIDTRKWICVEADDVKTAVYGDLVCFCMIDSEYADALTADDVTGAFTKIMNGEAEYKEGAEPNIPEME